MPSVQEVWSLLIHRGEIPLLLKIVYSLFVCVLVPVYWRAYGPANFLWFSDIALFVTLAAVWMENSLLASTQALSALIVESAWNVDFFLGLVLGKSPLGLAEYMFDGSKPLFLRGLSLFHVALPPLLIWLVYRLGYDSRALPVQTAIAWVVLPVCYFFTAPSANINWVFGPGAQPQTWMPSGCYLALLLLLFPLGVYLPTHFALKALFGK